MNSFSWIRSQAESASEERARATTRWWWRRRDRIHATARYSRAGRKHEGSDRQTSAGHLRPVVEHSLGRNLTGRLVSDLAQPRVALGDDHAFRSGLVHHPAASQHGLYL